MYQNKSGFTDGNHGHQLCRYRYLHNFVKDYISTIALSHVHFRVQAALTAKPLSNNFTTKTRGEDSNYDDG